MKIEQLLISINEKLDVLIKQTSKRKPKKHVSTACDDTIEICNIFDSVSERLKGRSVTMEYIQTEMGRPLTMPQRRTLGHHINASCNVKRKRTATQRFYVFAD